MPHLKIVLTYHSEISTTLSVLNITDTRNVKISSATDSHVSKNYTPLPAGQRRHDSFRLITYIHDPTGM